MIWKNQMQKLPMDHKAKRQQPPIRLLQLENNQVKSVPIKILVINSFKNFLYYSLNLKTIIIDKKNALQYVTHFYINLY